MLNHTSYVCILIIIYYQLLWNVVFSGKYENLFLKNCTCYENSDNRFEVSGTKSICGYTINAQRARTSVLQCYLC